MQLLHTVEALAGWRSRQNDVRVGLVPTMGNLHAGHRALLQAAVERCDRVVASIFVNPLQFGPHEDFASYPHTPQADRDMLEAAGVDAVFAPSVEQMYPDGESPTRIHVVALNDMLCGQFRAGHFEGVATVVAKLFNLARPQAAFFGEKDYQQLAIIRRLAIDLCMGVEVIGVATVREPDGLALSSRNQYLAPDERRQAPQLAAALHACVERLANGERDFGALQREGMARLHAAGFEPEYFAIRDERLGMPDGKTTALRVLAAAKLGRTRLIDNIGWAVPA